MEWISVKDRLPELDKLILTCDKNGEMETGKFLIMEGMICYTDNNYYPIIISDSYVTHWMPLPEPPKQ